MKRTLFVAAVVLVWTLWAVQAVGQVVISDGGVTFPDGTVQTTATAGNNPDPPCFNNTNRFVDCNNGTVTDTRGAIWLENANCFGQQDYATAHASAASLAHGQCGLTDGSRPGDWRLPTADEWLTMFTPAGAGCTEGPYIFGNGTPEVGCFSDNPWASQVVSGNYWSSTTTPNIADRAWQARLAVGALNGPLKTTSIYVWPVRTSPVRDP